jgi:DNA-binding response OmpR family regulator
MNYSILVVEDDVSIAEPVRSSLPEGYATVSASSGKNALQFYLQKRPSLVILDGNLSDISSLEVCRQLRSSSQGLPILLFTDQNQWQSRALGLENGADDVLVRPFEIPQLLARVRAMLRRFEETSKSITFGELSLSPRSRTATYQRHPLSLTLLEYRLLDRLIRRPNTVLGKDQLLREIWQWDGISASDVIEVHISALRSKIGVKGKRLIRTVRGVGYSLSLA